MSYHLYITLPLYLLLHTGLYGIFVKAGEKGWKAFVPVYNVLTWLELIGRPKWWILFFLVPVLNFVMGIGIVLDLVRSFDKHKFWDQLGAVLFPYIYFLYLGFNKKDEYKGKWMEIKENEPKKSGLREWLDAILFAGTAALVIRIFLIEAFMIPTTSMEGSLLAGDFLFVSKFHYGVRLPMAPLSMPFVHNTLPFSTSSKSFVNVQLPYSRLPGLKPVKRNEIVVFNYPADDIYPDVPELGPIEITSMKQNYIKRCVAVAGDTFQIKDQTILINGKPGWQAENVQHTHDVSGIYPKLLVDFGFRYNPGDANNNVREGVVPGTWMVDMSDKKAAELKAKYPAVQIEKKVKDYNRVIQELWGIPGDKVDYRIKMQGLMGSKINAKSVPFPKRPDMEQYLWTVDNFGPIWIPKEGVTIDLTLENLPMYERIIDVYEDHDLEVKGTQIFIDGQPASTYTFEMDYYFMVGDNRHQSLDSRFWGYVPEDHIIGRPWFVLFSTENGLRWDRTLSGVGRWEP